MIKPKLSYANVTATLALVFSMTGGAMAAHHYLISSTKQISPKVIKSLKGKAGPQGPVGPQGSAGSQGPAGPAGSAVAFAYVSGVAASPTLSATKNVTSVSRLGPGVTVGEYCITTSVPIQNATGIADVISGDGVAVSANTALLPTIIATGDCPPGTTIVVVTSNSTERKNANFWVSFN